MDPGIAMSASTAKSTRLTKSGTRRSSRTKGNGPSIRGDTDSSASSIVSPAPVDRDSDALPILCRLSSREPSCSFCDGLHVCDQQLCFRKFLLECVDVDAPREEAVERIAD